MHSRLGAVFVAVFALGGGLTVPSVPADAGHTPTCLNRKATIVGTPGNDTLRGTSKADVIVGLGGHDSITGRGGSDYICGGGGRDVIDAGDGSDSLSGGAGDDRLVARQAELHRDAAARLHRVDRVARVDGAQEVAPVVDDRVVAAGFHRGVARNVGRCAGRHPRGRLSHTGKACRYHGGFQQHQPDAAISRQRKA